MKRLFSIHETAEIEINEAIDFYDLENPGLGSIFIDEIQRSIEIIARFPEAAPLILGRVRKKPLVKFPYFPQKIFGKSQLGLWDNGQESAVHIIKWPACTPKISRILENATPGERTVFRFLREAARPDSDFIGWYEPAIGEQGREPDFVLFGNQHGLLVLEVKDWLIDQIEEADSHHFKIWIGGHEENKTNPDRQARGYVYELMNVLKEIPEFQSGPGGPSGAIKNSDWTNGGFSNISRKDYLEQGLDQVTPAGTGPFPGRSG